MAGLCVAYAIPVAVDHILLMGG